LLALAAFLTAALAGAALLAATFTTEATFLGGRPTGRAGAFATTALRPVVLAAEALEARAAGAALTALVAVARPVDLAAVAFAAALTGTAFLAGAAFLAAAFLLLRSALKPVAGLKRMPLDAAILTGWPVRGLRPVRALRAVGLKLPKP
jgi:hypothetical protein